MTKELSEEFRKALDPPPALIEFVEALYTFQIFYFLISLSVIMILNMSGKESIVLKNLRCLCDFFM